MKKVVVVVLLAVVIAFIQSMDAIGFSKNSYNVNNNPLPTQTDEPPSSPQPPIEMSYEALQKSDNDSSKSPNEQTPFEPLELEQPSNEDYMKSIDDFSPSPTDEILSSLPPSDELSPSFATPTDESQLSSLLDEILPSPTPNDVLPHFSKSVFIVQPDVLNEIPPSETSNFDQITSKNLSEPTDAFSTPSTDEILFSLTSNNQSSLVALDNQISNDNSSLNLTNDKIAQPTESSFPISSNEAVPVNELHLDILSKEIITQLIKSFFIVSSNETVLNISSLDKSSNEIIPQPTESSLLVSSTTVPTSPTDRASNEITPSSAWSNEELPKNSIPSAINKIPLLLTLNNDKLMSTLSPVQLPTAIRRKRDDDISESSAEADKKGEGDLYISKVHAKLPRFKDINTDFLADNELNMDDDKAPSLELYDEKLKFSSVVDKDENVISLPIPENSEDYDQWFPRLNIEK